MRLNFMRYEFQFSGKLSSRSLSSLGHGTAPKCVYSNDQAGQFLEQLARLFNFSRKYTSFCG